MDELQRKRLAELMKLRSSESLTETELKELGELQALEKDAGDTVQLTKKEIADIASKAVEEKTSELSEEVRVMKKAQLSQGLETPKEAKMQRAVKQIGKMWRAVKDGDKKTMEEVQKEIKQDFFDMGYTKALNETTAEDGGYLVPDEFHRTIQRLVEEFGVARKVCRVMPMSRLIMNIPCSTAQTTVSGVAEAGGIAASTPQFVLATLEAKKFAVLVVGTSELLEDNATDVEIWNFVAELIAEDIGVNEDTQVFVGDGTGQNLLGILPHTNADIVDVVMADTKVDFTDMTFGDLKDMQTGINTNAAKKGVYVMHKSIFAIAEKFQDEEGQYIYRAPGDRVSSEGDIAGFLWNKPVYLTDVMPDTGDTAVSTPFVIFGELKKYAVIGDRRRTTLKQLTEATIDGVSLGETDQEALRATQRIAFQITKGGAISRLVTAAT